MSRIKYYLALAFVVLASAILMMAGSMYQSYLGAKQDLVTCQADHKQDCHIERDGGTFNTYWGK